MLPFVAGIAAGAVAVVAYNNNKKIKAGVKTGAKKVKEIADEVKTTVSEKVDCLKSKDKEENIVVEEKSNA